MKKLEEFTPQLYLSDYGILHRGIDGYSIVHTEEEWKTPEKIERRIERIWEKEKRRAEREGRELWSEPGSMLRVRNMYSYDRRLVFVTQTTNYKQYAGTRGLKELYSPDDSHYAWNRANPLAANLLLSVDGYLLFGLRSNRLIFDGGKIGAVSGSVDPSKDIADGNISVEKTVRREFEEEIKMKPRFKELKPFVVQYNPVDSDSHLEFWFLGYTDLTKQEIERDFKKNEFDSLVFLKMDQLKEEFNRLENMFTAQDGLIIRYLIDSGEIYHI